MRTGRLLAVGGIGALLLSLAQPVVAKGILDPEPELAPGQEAPPRKRAKGILEQDDPEPVAAPQPEPAAPEPETPARKAPPARRNTPAKNASPTAAPAKNAPPTAAPDAPVKNAAPIAAPAVPELTPSGKPAVTAADVRPPVNLLLDCAKAPSEAVTKLPDELARWATVYCTKLGHVFNADDRHFGAFPDSGVRASFSAAEMAGKSGELGNEAYFSKITYRELPSAERDALIARDPGISRILVGKSLWRLDLTARGGASLSFIVIDPSADVFWVFPLNEKGLSTPAFYVTGLEMLNKVR